jgi:hypothetical protein
LQDRNEGCTVSPVSIVCKANSPGLSEQRKELDVHIAGRFLSSSQCCLGALKIPAGIAQAGALESLVSGDCPKEVRDRVAKGLVDARLTLTVEKLVGVRNLALCLKA